MLLSDKMEGYKTGYKNTMNAEPPTTMHVPDSAISNICNNQHERHNGDGKRRKKGSRGFDSDIQGLFVLDEIYHNFLRPRMGLRNDPGREGGHYDTWARQAAHPDAVRRGLPLQPYLMRPHVHDLGAAPPRRQAASGVINCIV